MTAVSALFVALTSWQRRQVAGATSLALLMFAVVEWSLGFTAEYTVLDIPSKLFWSKIEYFGTVSAPVFLLLFALEFNQLHRLITPRNLVLLFLVPVISLGLALTNEWHGLIWSSVTPSPAGENLVIYGHGAWFWVGVVGYSYLMLFSATLLIVWATIRFSRHYRGQVVIILIAVLIPWVSNIIYVAGWSPLPGLEITPISLAITGILLALGIFRFGLFELVPVARDILIEVMSDGVVVLDRRYCVVDINPAAERLIGVPREEGIGHSLENIWNMWPQLSTNFDMARETHTEIALKRESPFFLEISVMPVYGRKQFTGWLLLVRDSTNRNQLEGTLKQTNAELRAQISKIEKLQDALREQAVRDPLTGLFNRRYLDEALPGILLEAVRDNVPVSLFLLDIDNFKSLNDTHGHEVGDEVLKTLGGVLSTKTRGCDVACRFGGDEFVVVMPGLPPAKAFQRADQLRVAFRDACALHGDIIQHTTLSCGVAVFPFHGAGPDEVMRSADNALYLAKSAGRNQAVLCRMNGNINAFDPNRSAASTKGTRPKFYG